MFPKPDISLQSKLDDLYAHGNENVLFFFKSPVPSILERILSENDIAALPYLLPFIHHANSRTREAAEIVVTHLLPQLDTSQIVDLESLLHERWSNYNSHGNEFRARTNAGWKLSTMAGSGWRREEAVTRLARAKDMEALPFILLRLNDWVPQVKQAAEHWFSSYSKVIGLKQVAQCIPILAALEERDRGRTSPSIRGMIDRLEAPEAAAELLGALPSVGSLTRRLVFSLLSRGGSLNKAEIQQLLIKHENPMLGVLLLKYLRADNFELADELLKPAISSRSLLLRRSAWYCLSERQIGQSIDALSKALFDPAKSMRSFAQYHMLKRTSAEDLQNRYIEALETPSVSNRMTATSILGYHESHGRWLPPSYQPWLIHTSFKVRSAALRCFAAYHFDEALPWLKKELLNAGSPNLSKVAFALLRRHPYGITLNEIASMLEPEKSDIVRLRGFYLLSNRGKWDQLPLLLRLSRDISEPVSYKADQRLRVWLSNFNYSQVQPSQNQLAQAGCELGQSQSVLKERMYLEFRHLLNSVTVAQK